MSEQLRQVLATLHFMLSLGTLAFGLSFYHFYPEIWCGNPGMGAIIFAFLLMFANLVVTVVIEGFCDYWHHRLVEALASLATLTQLAFFVHLLANWLAAAAR